MNLVVSRQHLILLDRSLLTLKFAVRTNGVVGGGVVESGSLKYGTVTGTNATNDTATGRYFTTNFTPDTA